jgi:hypothetical protein
MGHSHGFGYAARAPCGHRAGCRRHRCGHGGAAPILGAAIDVIENALIERANQRNGQVSGVTRDIAATQYAAPPQYPSDKPIYIEREKEIETSLDQVGEPPAYTPRASPADNQHMGLPQIPPAHVPVSSKVQDLNADFSALPILQSRTSAVIQDIEILSHAMASIKMGDHKSKHDAKRATKQLLRDVWAQEEVRQAGRGTGCRGRMSCEEKKRLKAQLKGLKYMVKEEVREDMRALRGRG